ncbi:hypothetical protein, partial [Bacillus cereus]
ALYWSNGLRALLKEIGFELDDRADGKVASDEASAGTPLARIPASTWYRYIARHPGRPLALLHAAEKGGAAAVRALIETWGLTWGLDVQEPDVFEAGTVPTADEVLQSMERETLAARMAVWRDEFDRQDRERRASRIVRQAPGAWDARKDAQAALDAARVVDGTETFLSLLHRRRRETLAAAQ